MRNHLKRQKAPKNWSIPRKAEKFIVKDKVGGIPVLVLLREVLGVVRTRRELKKAINKKDVLVNEKPILDDKAGMKLFDTISLIPGKEYYRLTLNENGKYVLEKITEAETGKKVAKIVGKKVLKGKKVQLNLSDGRNYFYDKSVETGSSVILDLKKKRVSKVLPLKEKANVIVFGGKHSGFKGKIGKLIPELKMAEVTNGNETFRVLTKQLMVIE